MNYKDIYNYWLLDDFFDEQTKAELNAIKDDEKEIEDRFFKDLEFGTGGLRGVIGAGTNRMNIYTVSKATQGLADYILDQADGKAVSVCIAYDSRRMSPLFAKTAALVLAGNGIKAYLFDDLRPTPELSFAVRNLGSISGIVITASHNPKIYNGYKVYWSDGGQVPYPKDAEIISYVNKITDFKTIKSLDEQTAIMQGLLCTIGKQIDDLFIKSVKEQSINGDLVKKMSDDICIVYTPLNGTGNIPVRRVLDEIGFKHVHVVKEQELPDTEFTTVGYPNPEDRNAFKLALELAQKVNADVILATDPDCDRVGTIVKNNDGEYVILTGNMIGVLLMDYIIKERTKKNIMPSDPAVISTIVSTDMARAVARKNNIDYYEVLTGFKYIGEKIKEFEQTGSNNFIFGFEESYGCLAGTHARDKDAVVASMLICEMTAFYKQQSMSLYDGLISLYEEYGYYRETIENITLPGIDGLNDMKKMMASLRENPITQVNGINVTTIRDYKSGIEKNIKTSEQTKLDMPVSDVLYYTFDDESWFAVRPSGTEPKIKIYFGIKANSMDSSLQMLDKFKDGVMKLVANDK